MVEMLFIADIVKPNGMDDAEFFEIWNAEAVAASAALDAGAIKLCGKGPDVTG